MLKLTNFLLEQYFDIFQEEFKRMEEEEADRKTKLENEMHGWVESNGEQEVVGTVPAPNIVSASLMTIHWS